MHKRGHIFICEICGEESLDKEVISKCEARGFEKPKFAKNSKIEFNNNNIWMPGTVMSIKLSHESKPIYRISVSRELSKLLKFVDKSNSFIFENKPFSLNGDDNEFDEVSIRKPKSLKIKDLLQPLERARKQREEVEFQFAWQRQ